MLPLKFERQPQPHPLSPPKRTTIKREKRSCGSSLRRSDSETGHAAARVSLSPTLHPADWLAVRFSTRRVATFVLRSFLDSLTTSQVPSTSTVSRIFSPFFLSHFYIHVTFPQSIRYNGSILVFPQQFRKSSSFLK